MFGITTYAGMTRSFAASAEAAAWLPDECVTTPFAATASESDRTALEMAHFIPPRRG
jgi:hypothetical protein